MPDHALVPLRAPAVPARVPPRVASVRALTSTELDALRAAADARRTALGLPPDPGFAAAVKGIARWIDAHLAAGTEPSEDDVDGAIALFGRAVREKLGWDWLVAELTDETELLVLASPDRCSLCAPGLTVRAILAGHRDNALVPLFNLLASGQVPKAPPGSYALFG